MSSIIFHCIICFDPFNSKEQNERYPVCLPCGHTYICNECASRIDKCYECRTNLFYYVEDENVTNTKLLQTRQQVAGASYTTRPSQSRSAYRRGVTPAPQPKKKTKKRFPLPKNLVLLSLIESNENTTKAQKETAQLLSGKEKIDEDDVNLHLFLESQLCGTYMVTSKNGLSVYKHKPKDSNDNSSLYEEQIASSIKSNNELIRVNYGDHVQIVSIEDNYALLARQNGYISSDQLIRVSGPRDDVCRTEGMLYNLFIHWKSVEKQSNKISKLKTELMQELNDALLDNDVTVQPATGLELQALEEKMQKEEKLKDEKRSDEEKKNQEEVREKPESIKEYVKENRVKHNTVHPNMRTGRSGHCALLSSKVHVYHKNDNGNIRHVGPLHKISTHTGLTMPKVHD